MSERDINALARNIAEHRTGMPAYLVDDEMWAAALAEAEATYVSPPPKSKVQEAVDRARRPDPVAFIEAYNKGRLSSRAGEQQMSEDARMFEVTFVVRLDVSAESMRDAFTQAREKLPAEFEIRRFEVEGLSDD